VIEFNFGEISGQWSIRLITSSHQLPSVSVYSSMYRTDMDTGDSQLRFPQLDEELDQHACLWVWMRIYLSFDIAIKGECWWRQMRSIYDAFMGVQCQMLKTDHWIIGTMWIASEFARIYIISSKVAESTPFREALWSIWSLSRNS